MSGLMRVNMTTRKFTEDFNRFAVEGITATELKAHGKRWVGIAVDDTVLEIYSEKQIEELTDMEELANILSRAWVYQLARTQRNVKVICHHPMCKAFEKILNERNVQ